MEDQFSTDDRFSSKYLEITYSCTHPRLHMVLGDLSDAVSARGGSISSDPDGTENGATGSALISSDGKEARYEFTVQRQDQTADTLDTFSVKEEIYFPDKIDKMLASLFVLLAVFLIQPILHFPLLIELALILGPAALGMFIMIYIVEYVRSFSMMVPVESDKFSPVNKKTLYDMRMLPGAPLLAANSYFWLGAQTIEWVHVTLACVSISVGVYNLSIGGEINRYRERLGSVVAIPDIPKEYLMFMINISLPIAASLMYIFSVDQTPHPVFIGAMGLLTPFNIWLAREVPDSSMFSELTVGRVSDSTTRFYRSSLSPFVLIAIASIVSYALFSASIFASWYYISTYGGSSVAGSIPAIGFLLPSLMIGTGIFYQTVSPYVTLARWYRQTTPQDVSDFSFGQHLDDIDPTGVEVWVIDDGIHQISSFSTLSRNVVILPRELIDGILDERELAAIFAHEYAHVAESNDGLIGTYAGIVSSMLLVGRNVLLACLGFHIRENEADVFAAETVSGDDLASALEAIEQELQLRSGRMGSTGLGGAIRATGTSDTNPATTLRATLNQYYGPWAMTQAHPPIEERIDRLRKRSPVAQATADA